MAGFIFLLEYDVGVNCKRNFYLRRFLTCMDITLFLQSVCVEQLWRLCEIVHLWVKLESGL